MLKIAMFFPKVTFNTFQTNPIPIRAHLKHNIQNVQARFFLLFNYLDIEDSAYRIEADETKLMHRRIEFFGLHYLSPPFE